MDTLVVFAARREKPASDDALFLSETRLKILHAVNESPGVMITQLKRSLDMGGGGVNYHIGKLEEQGLVETREVGRQTYVYPHGEAPATSELVLLMPGVRRVAQVVLDLGEASSSDVARATGFSQRSATEYLTVLHEARWLTKKGMGRATRYSPRASLRTRLG